MYDYYITFQSVSRAQRAIFALTQIGIQAILMKTPKAIAQFGCGYAIKVSKNIFYPALRNLQENHIFFEHLFRIRQNGTMEEVIL